MAQVPTPPMSRQASASPESQLRASTDLDSLLERYLALLDRHQSLQADLAKQLSSGFLSLAQANYTCPPGRRYGTDYYDERMKATRTVAFHPSQERADGHANDTASNNLQHAFTIESTKQRPDEHPEHPETDETPDDTNVKETQVDDETPPENPEFKSESESESNAPMPQKPPKSRARFRSSNPITWYGILVPPSLRSSQQFFTEAVAKQVPELATVVAEMQVVEREVDKARGQLDSQQVSQTI